MWGPDRRGILLPELRYDSGLADDAASPGDASRSAPGKVRGDFVSQPTLALGATGSAADTVAGGPGSPGPAPTGEIPVIDGYEILGELGRGGMAVVYQARQLSLDRIVAIKLMSPRLAGDSGFAARFEREALALAALQHPNVVAIHDRGRSGDRLYFVMEFVQGYSVRRVIEEAGGPLALEWVFHLMTQVADALAYVHGRGTIHRDIKPENVLVTDEGLVKVSDFGLAGLLARKESGNLTVDGSAMGTLNYMAPEQRLDARSVDQRADIYSFGVMLYEVLTGQLPIGAWRPPSQVVRTLPKGFDALVDKCLQPDPKMRMASIAEVRAELGNLQQAAAAAPEAGPAGPAKHDELQEAMERLQAQAKAEERKKQMKERFAGLQDEDEEELRRSAAQVPQGIRWKQIFGFFGQWTEAVIIAILIGMFLLAGGFRTLFPEAPPEEEEVAAAPVAVKPPTPKPKEDKEARRKKQQEKLASDPVKKVADPLDELLAAAQADGTTGVLDPAAASQLTTTEARILALFPDPTDKGAVLRALGSEDPLAVVAAVRLEEAGLIRFSVKTYEKLLEKHGDPLLRQEVIDRIAARSEDPGATGLLHGLIDQGGEGAGYALTLLRSRGQAPVISPDVARRFVVEAALIRGPDPASLRAVQALGAVDGEDATELLKKLRTDSSAAISRVATAAWEYRVRVGLVAGKQAVPEPGSGPGSPDEDWGEAAPPTAPQRSRRPRAVPGG